MLMLVLLQVLTDKQTVRCCAVCSCSSDCQRDDTCCPDARIDTTRVSFCYDIGRDLTYRRNMPQWFLSNVQGQQQGLIDRCPLNNEEPLCIGSIDEIIVVSDSKGNVYRNKHCAHCHGVTDLTAWEMYAYQCTCLYAMAEYAMTLDERDHLIRRNCEIVALPPVAGKEIRAECLQDQIKILKYKEQCRPSDIGWHYNICNEFSAEERFLRVHAEGNITIMELFNPLRYECSEDANNTTCQPTDTNYELLPAEWFELIAMDRDFGVNKDQLKHCGESEISDQLTVRLCSSLALQ